MMRLLLLLVLIAGASHSLPHSLTPSRTLLVLEIDSHSFNATHALLLLRGLSSLTPSLPHSPTIEVVGCVHSSHGLIHDPSLQHFLYSHTHSHTHSLTQFFFSSSPHSGFLCATEAPPALLRHYHTLLQLSATAPLSTIPSLHHSLTHPTAVSVAPDLSLMQIPTSGIPALLSSVEAMVAWRSEESSLTRVEVATHVSEWMSEWMSANSSLLVEDDAQEEGQRHCLTSALDPPAATAVHHSSGPCNLWWPLNHTELFLLASTRVSERGSGVESRQELREPLIFTCPDLPLYSRGTHSRTHSQGHYIAVLEGFRASDGVTPSDFDMPSTARTQQVVSFEGTALHDQAVQLHTHYLLPASGGVDGTAVKWVRVSICHHTVRDLSECVSSFTLSRTVVYGDTWQPPNPLVPHSLTHPHPMTTQIHTRDVFGHALNMFGVHSGTFVEVGVNKGHYARVMLQQWRGHRYVMVDPWRTEWSSAYVDIANHPEQRVHDEVMKEALHGVSAYGSRVAVIRNTSVGAAAMMLDDSVDVVYIDALHHYQGVMQDIHAW